MKMNSNKNLMTLVKLLLVSVALAPAVVYSAPQNFRDLVENFFIPVVKNATYVVMMASLLYFFWGLVKFIFSQGNEAAKKDGKTIMTWGLLAIMITFSLVGILNFFSGRIQIDQYQIDTSVKGSDGPEQFQI